MDCLAVDLERIPFVEALEWQRYLSQARAKDEIGNTVLVAEHPHTFSFGRKATREQLVWDEDERKRRRVDVISADRGGGVTYHGPGQLVIYPIMKLESSPDLHRYLRQLEETAIRTLSAFSIKADRLPGLTGVWIGERKIASIGIGFAKGVTRHGLSLNVSCDLSYFEGIVACGLSAEATTMKEISATTSTGEVAEVLLQEFGKIFEVNLGRSAAGEVAVGNLLLRKRGYRATNSASTRRCAMPDNGDLFCAHGNGAPGALGQRIRIMGEHASPEGTYHCSGSCAIHRALGCWPRVAECRFATLLEPEHGVRSAEPKIIEGVFCPGEDLCVKDRCKPEPKISN